MSAWIRGAVAAAAVGLGSPAAAAPAPSIPRDAKVATIVGGAPGHGELESRLEAELRAAGITTTWHPAEPAGADPIAGPRIVVDAAAGTISIHVPSMHDAAPLRAEVTLPPPSERPDARAVALAVVDSLEALLQEAAQPPAPPDEPPPPPAKPEDPEPDRGPRLVASLHGGVMGSFDGLGAVPLLDLGLGVEVTEWLTPTLVLAAPVLSLEREQARTSVRAWPLMIAAGVRVHTRARATRWRAELLGAVGAAAVSLRGEAAPPLEGRRDQRGVGLVRAELAASVRLRPRLRLRASAGIMTVFPAVSLEVVGQSVARLGPVLAVGTLGVEGSFAVPTRRAQRGAASP